ncbi:RNA-binding protein [Clostridium ganghwense]|uniref:YlmH/Sll1252 family protein n=1 Tax=Clostridium ganghwense TaxID=312089 RepID=A0ABT4CQ21_9CLOT|nr:YlmH/Sll1252 family protein [Clostridium ganghwense]MCY6370346.1 YlmH/Sll1252 family protein [Clostridium ganghwense]
MNKKEFLANIDFEDKVALSNIYDKIALSIKINKSLYLNEFYPPSIWNALKNISDLLECNIGSFGVFEESERRIIAILPLYEDEDFHKYPVELIKINNKSSFSKLGHSDFLGALMSLGIKREKFGDLIVEDQSCYIPVFNEVCYYVKENLSKIGRAPCSIEILDRSSCVIPQYKFEEKNIIVTSMRSDCVISALCNISRSASVDMINKGKVLTDYQRINNKNQCIREGTIIAVRGYGKFKILEVIGKTQKQRSKVKIKKYI